MTKKTYQLNPKRMMIPLDMWQQWQLEYWGNPVYSQQGIRLGQAFINTFFPNENGDFWQDLSTVGSTQATLMICDYLVDFTDHRQIALSELRREFEKGDPSHTEGVIITPRSNTQH